MGSFGPKIDILKICSLDYSIIVPNGKHQKVVLNGCVGFLRKIIIISELGHFWTQNRDFWNFCQICKWGFFEIISSDRYYNDVFRFWRKNHIMLAVGQMFRFLEHWVYCDVVLFFKTVVKRNGKIKSTTRIFIMLNSMMENENTSFANISITFLRSCS